MAAMFDQLIADLVASGMTEAEIADQLPCSQASVNRIKLGKQKKVGHELGEAIKKLHAARLPAQVAA